MMKIDLYKTNVNITGCSSPTDSKQLTDVINRCRKNRMIAIEPFYVGDITRQGLDVFVLTVFGDVRIWRMTRTWCEYGKTPIWKIEKMIPDPPVTLTECETVSECCSELEAA